MAPVLVDTSVFIDFFRGLHTAETVLFEKLIDADRVGFCGMVEAEIRYGLRASDKGRVLDLLQGFTDWKQLRRTSRQAAKSATGCAVQE